MMSKQSILSLVFAGAVVFAATVAGAAEAVPSNEELLNQCRQFAAEDQISPKEMDAYVSQCVLDLKEQYLPAGGLEKPRELTAPPANASSSTAPPAKAPPPPR